MKLSRKEKKRSFVSSIATAGIVFGVAVSVSLIAYITSYAVSSYSISKLESEISILNDSIESNKIEVSNIDATKISLHTAAEDLRQLTVSSETVPSTILALSTTWSEIDAAQSELAIQIENDSAQLSQLSSELEELERQRGKFLGVFETTAYWSGEDSSTTSTGVTPKVGVTIAVDPRVIPYGTTLHLIKHNTGEDLGYRVAQDCGGAIKGNRLDLFLGTDAECRAWGRQQLDVYVVE